MKTYDLVKRLLEESVELRNSDKKLIWRVWEELNLIVDGDLYYTNFMKAPSTETIRRCRQMIQAEYPELQASEDVRQKRHEIENQRGTHIFRSVIGEQTGLL